MHILIAVHFNAPHGGLHENIFSTVKRSLNAGHRVTVLCKGGEFERRLKELGVKVITTDFTSIEEDVERVINSKESNFDVIHTHPGPSRKVAVPLAERLGIPLFITFHGMWHDHIKKYVDKVSIVFAVSEGIKDYLRKWIPVEAHMKIIVMPNGVDSTFFKPKKFNLLRSRTDKKIINISLVTRLDKDKDFIIQMYYKALKFTSEAFGTKVKWTIVGDGTKQEEMKDLSDQITRSSKQQKDFIGWKSGKDLLKCYLNSDIVVAPGRCALEAMSCGKPVIAVGSKKYTGLINEENWLKGIYTNFGGMGSKMEGYQEGSIENDLAQVIENESLRERLGELGIFITKQFYNEDAINDRIVKMYEAFHKMSSREV